MTEAKKDKGSLILLHLIFAQLFAVMPLVQCGFAYAGLRDTNTQETFMFAAVMVVVPLSWMLYLRGRIKIPVLLFDALIWLIVGIGAIGLATSIGMPAGIGPQTIGKSVMRASDNAAEQTAVFVALVLRLIAVVYFIGRSSAVVKWPVMKILTGWLWTGCFLVCLTSLGVSIQTGVGPQSEWRLGEQYGTWLTPNHTGNFSAILILLCFQLRHLPKLARIAGVGLGAYILLLTQARMTMLSLAIGLVVLGLIEIYNNRRYLVPVVASFTLVIVTVAGPLREQFLQLGPVQKIVFRSARADWTTGRAETNSQAWEMISSAPPWGNGWSSAGSRFENGLLSIGVETGVIGMALNVLLVLLVLRIAWRTFRYSTNQDDRQLGALLLALWVYIVTRSVGERQHLFQVTPQLTNSMMILVAYAITVTHWRQAQTAKAPAPTPQPTPLRAPAGPAVLES